MLPVTSLDIKKFLSVMLFSAGFAFAAAITLEPVRVLMQERLRVLRNDAVLTVETKLGKHISYAGTGLAFPALIDIKDISITDMPDVQADAAAPDNKAKTLELPNMNIGRLRIWYSPFALLKNNPLDAVRGITIDRFETELEFEEDANSPVIDVQKPEIELNAILKNAVSFLPKNTNVKLNRGKARLTSKDFSALFTKISAALYIKNDRAALSASWQLEGKTGALASLNNKKPLDFTCGAKLRVELSAEQEKARMELRLSKIKSSIADLNAIAFSAETGDSGEIKLQKTGGRLPYSLALTYNVKTGKLEADFGAENFSPASFITLKSSLSQYAVWLPDSLSGSASAALDTKKSENLPAPVFKSNLNGTFQQRSPLGKTSFVMKGEGGTQKAEFSELALFVAQGRVSFSGGVVYEGVSVNGVLSINNFALKKDRPINGVLQIDTDGSTTSVFAQKLSIAGVNLQDLTVDFTREKDSAAFSASVLRLNETENAKEDIDRINIGRVSSSGFWNWQDNILESNLEMNEMSASDLYKIGRAFADIPEIPGIAMNVIKNIKFTANGNVSTNFRNITYNIPVFTAVYKDEKAKKSSLNGNKIISSIVTENFTIEEIPETITAKLSIKGTESFLSIDEANVIMPDGTLNFSGDFQFEDKNYISFRTGFSYGNSLYLINGEILDKNSLKIFGSYNLQAIFNLSKTGAFSGYVRIENARIPYKQQNIILSLAASVRYDAANSWTAGLDLFEVQNLSIGTTPIENIRITGSANQRGAELTTVSIKDNSGTLSGSAAAGWLIKNSGDNNFDIAETNFTLKLSNNSGSETINADGSYKDGIFNFHSTTTAFHLSRFIRNTYNASVSGTVDFMLDTITQNQNERWFFAVNLSSLSASLGGMDINISTNGYVNPSSFSLNGTRINAGSIAVSIPDALLRDGVFEADANISGSILEKTVNGAFNAKALFPDFKTIGNFTKELNNFNGSLNLSELQVEEWAMTEPASFDFFRSGDAFSINGGPDNMLRLELAPDGGFYAGLSYPSPVRGSVAGLITENAIDARGNNLFIDLSSLWKFVPPGSPVGITGGFAVADIAVRGPLVDPEFYGQVQGSSVRLEVPMFVDGTIGPLPILLRLEGQNMSFGPVRAPCGSGWGMVKGDFVFTRWIPDNFTITIDAENTSPIPYNVHISSVKAQGLTSGHIEIKMEDNLLSVTGDLLGENTEITVDAERFNSTPARSQTQFFVDLTIITGRRVEFLWPNEQFPILQANPALGNMIRIEYDSSNGSMSLKGDIEIRSGTIFYIERSFYIREGKLTFDEDETHFSPMLDARAEIRDRTDASDVVIRLIIDKQPLTQFQARFESVPALSQAEIFMLLGQSLVGTQTGVSGELTNALGGAVSDVLSQFYFVRRAEKNIRGFLGLDMFSVRTKAFTNVFLEWMQDSSTRQNQNSGTFNISHYFDNTSILAGKYLTNDLFLQGMLSLRYDETSSFGNLPGLRFETDLGLELHNPLFDIRFNITPSHPEMLFVPDTSISLIWRRSF